jgi:hypothetical protein
MGDLNLQSRRAEGNLATQWVEASGNVRMQTASGVVATTEQALFDGPHQLCSGNRPLRVRAPSYALDAQAFRVSSADEEFSFEGPLRSGLGRAR